jgi:hypothetical protein
MALTKFNYNSFDITPVASKSLAFNSDADGFTTGTAGSMTLIKTLTASSDGTLDFVDGSSDVVFDSTYDTYLFKFISIHPQTNDKHFSFNATIDGSNWNVTKTSSAFMSQHAEDNSGASSSYRTGNDLAQSTGNQILSSEVGSDADQSVSGELYFFSPSSTTYVKHFISTTNSGMGPNYSNQEFVGGYCNTTSAVTGVRFLFNSGNIDAGVIKLYGLTK